MFKNVLVAVSMLMVTSNVNAFELKIPKLGSGETAAASGDVDGEVKDFIAKSSEMRDIALNSLTSINAAFADETQLAKMQAEEEALKKMTDTKEIDVKKAAMLKTQEAIASDNLKQKDIGEKVKGLSDEKKQKITKSLFNFAIAALNAPKLIDKGQKIVSSVSITNIGKVLPVKDSLPILVDVVKYGSGTIGGFVKIAKGANLTIPNATADSKVLEEKSER